jgi:ATP-dependent protease HslVU (ClpYQ) ATPase subunit
MKLKKDRQEKAIAMRLAVQPKITDEEWKNIVAAANKTVEKDQEKMKKKEAKQNEKAKDDKLTGTAKEYINDEEKSNGVDNAYNEFRQDVRDLESSYLKINVVDNKLLSNKNATEKEMRDLADSLNEMREQMYSEYLAFLGKLREVTTPEEWEAIMKDLNKAL